jgi:hypothetical protein
VVQLQQLDNYTVALTNGLVARVFAVSPFFATWDIATLRGSALRAVSDEATVTLDGRTYSVGGAMPLLENGKECPLPHGVGPVDNCATAYFNRSNPYGANASAFAYVAHWTSVPTAPFPWRPARHAPDMPWPPLGLRLNVNMSAPADCDPAHQDIVVTLHYEMYQGIPAMSKWLTVTHTGKGDRSIEPPLPPPPPPASQLGLPEDQQGPICIEPCDAVLPPSDWVGRWLVTADVVAPITLAGQAGLCLTLKQGVAYHSYNDEMDALPCNQSDPLQQWLFVAATGLLYTKATDEAIEDLDRSGHELPLPCTAFPPTTPRTINSTNCGPDINNHQPNPGTVLGVGGFGSSDPGPLTARWRLVPDASGGKTVQIRATNAAYQDRCLWYTPLPPPPKPPPPPPPKQPCVPPSCVVLGGANVEILRVNAPWSPSGGAGMQGQQQQQQQPTAVLPQNHGLMFPRITQAHGTVATWSLDPTFDPAYSGNNGAIEPMYTAGYYGVDPPNHQYGGPGAHVRAPVGAGLRADPVAGSVPSGAHFDSFRVLTLFPDSVDDERAGLSVRKLTRLLAPQTSEAPMFMHLTDVSPAGVTRAVDQIVATGGGFDMIIFSFGSGFNLESTDPKYWAQVKASVSYANAHGVEIGGYDLIALSLTGKGYDAIDPATGKSAGSTCFASGWNRGLLKQVMTFIEHTGISMVETDGPYGGTPCGSTDHDHNGAEDSVQRQWENQAAFYAALRAKGVFVHAPDDYTFAGGANKNCGWYSEMQFSLPRWQHISISHAEVYDHTYFNTPTQTWMFAPLVDYHSGGPAAALEPFAQTGAAWEWTLANYLGAGVGACYRGDRLFDTPPVQAMVAKWMSFWRKYRPILVQDIIHVRRPDMQAVDCLLHVSANSSDSTAALAMLYNPTLAPQQAKVALPLYYTGEGGAVLLAREEGPFAPVTLGRDYSLAVEATLPPQSVTYFVVKRAKK